MDSHGSDSKLRYARISPQKCRLVADTVRGADVSKALNTLKFMPKKGADLIYKVLWSAVENAQNNQGADVDDLKVTTIHVDAAPHAQALRRQGQGPRHAHRQTQQSHHRRRRRWQEGRVSHGSKGQSGCHSPRHHP